MSPLLLRVFMSIEACNPVTVASSSINYMHKCNFNFVHSTLLQLCYIFPTVCGFHLYILVEKDNKNLCFFCKETTLT